MKRIAYLLFFWSSILLVAYAQGSQQDSGNDIVIENNQFKLIIGNNAVTKSLTLKSTGEECLMQDENISFFTKKGENLQNKGEKRRSVETFDHLFNNREVETGLIPVSTSHTTCILFSNKAV